MGGVLFAVAIALATIACVGIVIWASEYYAAARIPRSNLSAPRRLTRAT
jgi:hypothetical protein